MLDWLLPASALKAKAEAPKLVVKLGDIRLPLAIRRHKTARRMTMRLAPDGSEVRITMPRWGQSRDALEFAHSRAAWLTEQLGRAKPMAALSPASAIPFCGEILRIDWAESHPRRVVRDGGTLRCGGPWVGAARRIETWLKKEAAEAFAQDLAFYAPRAGKKPPALALSSAKRRWGSCSATGTIRLNWRLIMAPKEVRRSVVAHETAHLIHFDHSPAFYALLEEIYGGELRFANGWLKEHGRSLYAPFG